jgi:hypothetical protein
MPVICGQKMVGERYFNRLLKASPRPRWAGETRGRHCVLSVEQRRKGAPEVCKKRQYVCKWLSLVTEMAKRTCRQALGVTEMAKRTCRRALEVTEMAKLTCRQAFGVTKMAKHTCRRACRVTEMAKRTRRQAFGVTEMAKRTRLQACRAVAKSSFRKERARKGAAASCCRPAKREAEISPACQAGKVCASRAEVGGWKRAAPLRLPCVSETTFGNCSRVTEMR